MQIKHPILDDIAKVAGGASGLALGIKEDIENTINTTIEGALAKQNIVNRDEFEVLKISVDKLREENQALKAEIEKLKKKK